MNSLFWKRLSSIGDMTIGDACDALFCKTNDFARWAGRTVVRKSTGLLDKIALGSNFHNIPPSTKRTALLTAGSALVLGTAGLARHVAHTANNAAHFIAESSPAFWASVASSVGGGYVMAQGNIDGAVGIALGSLITAANDPSSYINNLCIYLGACAGASIRGLTNIYKGHRIKGAFQAILGAASGCFITLSKLDNLSLQALSCSLLALLTAKMITRSAIQDLSKKEYSKAAIKGLGAGLSLTVSALAIYFVISKISENTLPIEELVPTRTLATPNKNKILHPDKSKKLEHRPKHITLQTAFYNHGNADRDEISRMSTANHEEYCRRWGYSHQVDDDHRSERLLESDQCHNPRTGTDQPCTPYWTKIKTLLTALENGKAPNEEEWRVWLDDDMIIGDMRVDLGDLLDRLRESDSSIILTNDIQHTLSESHGPTACGNHCNKHVWVNTGAIFVRNDEIAYKILSDVWKLRNREVLGNDPNCITYGICPQQTPMCLHEQSAFADVLREDPRYLKKHQVTIVPPHTPVGVDINVFHRNGCFRRVRGEQGFSYESEDGRAGYPGGGWQPGSFMAQASGIPTTGYLCGPGPDSDTPRSLRRDKMQEMLDRVIREQDEIESDTTRSLSKDEMDERLDRGSARKC